MKTMKLHYINNISDREILKVSERCKIKELHSNGFTIQDLIDKFRWSRTFVLGALK